MQVSLKDFISKNISSSTAEINLSSDANKVAQKKVNIPVFDHSLIARLELEHQTILLKYNEIIQLAESKNYVQLSNRFEEFSSELISHIRMEDDELYLYMKNLASYNGSIEEKVCGEFISEMKKITISMFYILSQSPNIPVNDGNVEAFIGEFKGLGEVLQDRILREEKIIYPMYENSRKVVNIS